MTHDIMIIPADPRHPIQKQPLITNEMKAECIGEFTFHIESECRECIDADLNEDCEVCGGAILYDRAVTVPWDVCKEIYKRMAVVAAKHKTD